MNPKSTLNKFETNPKQILDQPKGTPKTYPEETPSQPQVNPKATLNKPNKSQNQRGKTLIIEPCQKKHKTNLNST